MRGRRVPLPVGTAEEISERLPPEQCPPLRRRCSSPSCKIWQRWHHATRLAGLLSTVSWFRWPVASTNPRRPSRSEHIVGTDRKADRSPNSIAPRSRLLVPPSAVRRDGSPFAREAARSTQTGPLHGRSGSPPRAAASRSGRRNGARAGSAWQHAAFCRRAYAAAQARTSTPLRDMA